MVNKKAKYLGFAENLQLKEGGTTYHPGDEISLPENQLAALVRGGHTFEGVEDEPLPGPGDIPDTEAAAATKPAKAK